MTDARLRAIAFDLDGTLIDSRHDLAAAVNLARADLGLEALSVDGVLGMIGEGARNLVRRALGGAPDEALLDRALERFRHHYATECTRRTRPFPGIDELLAELTGRVPLALVTNKPESFSRTIVDHFGWSGHFDPLIGGDSLTTRKPDPAGLLAVCERHSIAPGELLMVGDSGIDARTAVAAGGRFIFAAWGFARATERRELAAGCETALDASDLVRRIAARVE